MSRADGTVNVNDESITIRTETALAVGSNEGLGAWFILEVYLN